MIDKMVPISTVVWFQEGPGVRNTQYTNEGVKLLNVANLVDGEVDLSNTSRYVSEEEAYGKYKHFLVDKGDLIIASSGIKVDYFDKKMGFAKEEHLPLCMNTSTIRFKTLDTDVLDIRYFMYFLKSESFKQQLSIQITGSAQLNFGPSHLKKMNVKLVPIAQQRDIVYRLSRIDHLISLRKQQLSKLDELVKSRFIELFGDPKLNDKGWTVSALGEYMTLLTDFSANGSYELLDSNVVMYDEPNYAVMVRTTDLEAGDLTNGVKYIDQAAYELLSKSKLFGGELIMNKIGSAGKIYIMPQIDNPASLGRNAFMFRFDDRINMAYLYALLSSDYGTKEIQQYVRGAVTKTITKESTRSIRVIVPPIELQEQYAAFVEQTDKSKVEIQKSLAKLETLKKALMQKYFG